MADEKRFKGASWTFANGYKLAFGPQQPEDELRGSPHPVPWTVPSDIPEKNQVIVVTPYHQEVLGEEAAASWRELVKSTRPVELDQLHPTGRCTCGGSGDCEWCMSHCLYCGSSVWPHDEDEAADYEALGYPETGLVWTDADLSQMEVNPHGVLATWLASTAGLR